MGVSFPPDLRPIEARLDSLEGLPHLETDIVTMTFKTTDVAVAFYKLGSKVTVCVPRFNHPFTNLLETRVNSVPSKYRPSSTVMNTYGGTYNEEIQITSSIRIEGSSNRGFSGGTSASWYVDE